MSVSMTEHGMGLSCFEGRDKCNDFAIGIELEGGNEQPYRGTIPSACCINTRYHASLSEKITLDRIVSHLRYFAWS